MIMVPQGSASENGRESARRNLVERTGCLHARVEQTCPVRGEGFLLGFPVFSPQIESQAVPEQLRFLLLNWRRAHRRIRQGFCLVVRKNGPCSGKKEGQPFAAISLRWRLPFHRP